MRPIIRVENLGKQYRVGEREAAYATLREALTRAARAPFNRIRSVWQNGLAGLGRANGQASSNSRATNRFWALKGVNFEVRPGDVLGIVGRNGAGKSTLLKVLSRVTEPTTGEADLYGRVGSLLELGTGFHPELTGRENVYLNGAILGMARRDIRRKFDEIVEFAHVGNFLDTPVKRFSTGMYLRLAFAIAAYREPEILLVDEVLAVGDAQFQAKCLRKMRQLADSGRTILLVTHNLGAINTLCTSAVLLRNGELIASGAPAQVTATHLASMRQSTGIDLRERDDREGNGVARITHVAFFDDARRPIEHVICGDSVTIALGYQTSQVGRRPDAGFSCYSIYGHKLFHIDNTQCGTVLPRMNSTGEYRCRIGHLSLAPGIYDISTVLWVDGEVADHVHGAATINVVPGDYYRVGTTPATYGSLVLVDRDWETSEE